MLRLGKSRRRRVKRVPRKTGKETGDPILGSFFVEEYVELVQKPASL